MDPGKFIPESFRSRINRFNIAVFLTILFIIASLFYATSSRKGSTDVTSWPNIYAFNYLNPYNYINPYYRFTNGMRILNHITKHSELNYFTALRLSSAIVAQCEKFNVDPNLVFAIISVESTFKPDSVSDRGAVGLMQIMPSTAEYLSEEYGYSFSDEKSLLDPVTNVKLGIAYLDYLYERLGYIHYALWAYNYGPEQHRVVAARSPDFSPHYVKKVLKSWKYFNEQ